MVKAMVGQTLGTSTWREMSFEDIVRFADATGDHQWLHVDRERCLRESPYGAPIAHGYFTLSLVAVFTPLAFQTSATGRLFIEFAVAIV